MVTEDYVSFEIAKLLKERGFDVNCYTHYSSDGQSVYYNYQTPSDGINMPTLQMAMKWLREVHRLSIVSFFDYRSGDESWWSVHVDKIKEGFIDTLTGYCSYEEACETAIKYCLENLI